MAERSGGGSPSSRRALPRLVYKSGGGQRLTFGNKNVILNAIKNFQKVFENI